MIADSLKAGHPSPDREPEELRPRKPRPTPRVKPGKLGIQPPRHLARYPYIKALGLHRRVLSPSRAGHSRPHQDTPNFNTGLRRSCHCLTSSKMGCYSLNNTTTYSIRQGDSMQYHVDRPVDKIISVQGMAAIIEEHADEFGGAGRLAELMDVAIPPRPWNYLSTMLSLDVIDARQGHPVRRAGDLSDIDEGALPPVGDFPG